MAKQRIYCDHNATSPLRTSAREAMQHAMDVDGNPSSIHAFGRQSRRIIEDARSAIIEALGLHGYVLTFTSGATEALAHVLSPHVSNAKTKQSMSRLLVCATEHVAALQGHGFDEVHTLPVGADGVIDLTYLRKALESGEGSPATMVCVHGANNETGVYQPIIQIQREVQTAGAVFVSDLVQWAGRRALGAATPDAIVVSGHKLGGPAGIGAVIYNPARLTLDRGLIRGGGQEKGARAGTENRIGIAGFAAALVESVAGLSAEADRMRGLRDGFERELLAQKPTAQIFANDVDRLPNTSCFAIPGVQASTALMQLDLDGLAVSSGSACSSGKVRASHVLRAMGVEDALASGAIRVSFGHSNKPSDVEALIASIRKWAP